MALLAASALADFETTAVQEHMVDCAACREYFDAIKAICDPHQTFAMNMSSAGPGIALNPRLLSEIRERENSIQNLIPLLATFWRERMIGVCAAAALLSCVLIVAFWPRHERQNSNRTAEEILQTRAMAEGPPSKQIIYRLAVNRSFEELDRLLTREAGSTLANSEPVYRIHSMLRDSDF